MKTTPEIGFIRLPAKKKQTLVMKDAVVSTVFDLDATQSLSYGGSGQTWANLAAAPADGAAQTAYDFYLGATSGADSSTQQGDPAFVGSAGSPAAYFNMDSDRFSLKSGANTSFLKNLHKTTGGTPFWMAMAFRFANSGTACILGPATNTSSTTLGLSFNLSGGKFPQLNQRGDAAGTSTNSALHTGLNDGVDYVWICSFDGTTFRSWVNIEAKSSAFSFATATGDASGPASICARSGGGSNVTTNTRIYAVAMGNAFIGADQAMAIREIYKARHGRNYNL